ncbi:3D-(3,5/4)-trihydroxycyclohexane-1,2-dione acylhydrolase (decyclizing), partial [Clostridium perfringens]|nr:3D-(3,5/4)-trihydroxycyclohexane-1,2-dione acylhydrolase (decyclizing) [Clostridium perfringens]
SKDLAAFAEAFGIPVAETQAGKSALSWKHPLNLGAMGVTGSLAANRIAAKADLIIGIGTRYSDFTTSSKWAFQREDVSFLNLNVNSADGAKLGGEALIADAKEGLKALPQMLSRDGYQAGYEENELASLKAEWD